LRRDAQVWALFTFAALATGPTLTTIAIALALLTGFTGVVARGRYLTIYIRIRRWQCVCGDCSTPVVGFSEAKLGLLGVFTSNMVAAFAILAGTTSIAAATSVAIFTTFAGLLLALVAGAVVSISICCRIGTAFCARLLGAFTGSFIALATTTSTTAATFTALAGSAIGALFLAICVWAAWGWLATGLYVGVHRHGFAFGVKTLALRAALALGTAATATPTASATAVASVTSAFTAGTTAFATGFVAALAVGAGFAWFAAVAVAIAVAAVT
jgi:hypothetical protein